MKASFTLIRSGYRPKLAAFSEEGPHEMEITTLDGRCVLRVHGTGPQGYSLADLTPGFVYAIKGRSPSGDFSRRLLVP